MSGDDRTTLYYIDTMCYYLLLRVSTSFAVFVLPHLPQPHSGPTVCLTELSAASRGGPTVRE